VPFLHRLAQAEGLDVKIPRVGGRQQFDRQRVEDTSREARLNAAAFGFRWFHGIYLWSGCGASNALLMVGEPS